MVYTRGCWKTSQMPGGGEGNQKPCSLWSVVRCSHSCKPYLWAAHEKEANIAPEHVRGVWCGQAQATLLSVWAGTNCIIPGNSALYSAAISGVRGESIISDGTPYVWCLLNHRPRSKNTKHCKALCSVREVQKTILPTASRTYTSN